MSGEVFEERSTDISEGMEELSLFWQVEVLSTPPTSLSRQWAGERGSAEVHVEIVSFTVDWGNWEGRVVCNKVRGLYYRRVVLWAGSFGKYSQECRVLSVRGQSSIGTSKIIAVNIQRVLPLPLKIVLLCHFVRLWCGNPLHAPPFRRERERERETASKLKERCFQCIMPMWDYAIRLFICYFIRLLIRWF